MIVDRPIWLFWNFLLQSITSFCSHTWFGQSSSYNLGPFPPGNKWSVLLCPENEDKYFFTVDIYNYFNLHFSAFNHNKLVIEAANQIVRRLADLDFVAQSS